MSSDRHDADVIVVGGGFAGVAAAREAAWQGRRTILLEARERLGGRTWTETFAGERIELGGTWVHWFQPHLWTEITRYAQAIYETPQPTTYKVWEDGELRTLDAEEAWPRLVALWGRYMDGIRETLERPYDPLLHSDAIDAIDRLSMADRVKALELSRADEDWIAPYLAAMAGSSLEAGSYVTMARQYAAGGYDLRLFFDAENRYALVGGTRSLVEAMAADAPVDVRLGVPVSGVAFEGDGVVVTQRDGTRLRAAAAVVAVPSNVWSTLDFSPELPPAHREIAQQGVGASDCYKVWARIRGPREPMYVQGMGLHPFTVFFTGRILDDGQMLIGFGWDPDVDVEDHARMKAAFEAVVPGGEVVATKGQHWQRDEFSLGGWPHMKPGQLTRYGAELQRSHGPVSFATSDITVGGWHGFIDGAIESGLRAGRAAAATAARPA